MEETWKRIIIDDFDWNAEISNHGQVRSAKTQRLRSTQPKGKDADGVDYQYVILKHQNKRTDHPVHWLVAHMFIPNDNPTEKIMVQRKPIDGLPLNHVSTLTWVTRSEVTQAAHKKATRKSTGKKILQFDMQMNPMNEFPSVAAARRAGFKSIYSCLTGDAKHAHGCYWTYG